MIIIIDVLIYFLEFTLISATFYAKSATQDIASLTVVFTEEDRAVMK